MNAHLERPVKNPTSIGEIVKRCAAVALACLAAGCRPAGPAGAPTTPSPDSIVLERTQCFGTCPAYRLSITRAGAVHFQSRNPGDSARVATGSAAPGGFQALVERAASIGFDSLPDRIEGSRYCPDAATDHPSAGVEIFRGAAVKRVADYLGCREGLESLRRFENAIDSVAGSQRWVQPASRRWHHPHPAPSGDGVFPPSMGTMSIVSRIFKSGDSNPPKPADPPPATPPETGGYAVADIYRNLREKVFAVRPGELGLPEDGPFAALMETGYPAAAVSLVAIAEGTTSLYFSNGGGVIGAGEHAPVRDASARFLADLAAASDRLEPTAAHPLPAPGQVRFYLLSANGIRTAEAAEEELGDGGHALSPVFYAAHAVIAAVRENTPDGP